MKLRRDWGAGSLCCFDGSPAGHRKTRGRGENAGSLMTAAGQLLMGPWRRQHKETNNEKGGMRITEGVDSELSPRGHQAQRPAP